MSGIDITDVSSHADVKVHVKFTTDLQVKATYLKHNIVPDLMVVTYAFGPGQHRGWWVAVDVMVAGHKVLKPAADGSVRLGKDRSKATWSAWGRKDVQTEHNLPEELDKLVSELRPSGQVTLPAGG